MATPKIVIAASWITVIGTVLTVGLMFYQISRMRA